jgi:hypothetical protein
MRLRNLCLAVAAGSVLTACSSDLGVVNTQEPDVARALSTPDGIEAILKNGFVQMLGATNTSGSLTPAADVASFESYGSVANFAMNVRAAVPRSPIENTRGNATAGENFRDFQELSLRGRTVANAVNALDALVANGGSLGSPARNLRARAFGFFALGLANGEMALMYDSLGVIVTGIPSDSTPPLAGYAEGMATALAQLDTAIAMTQASAAASGGDGFPLTEEFMRMSTPPDADGFIEIVRSLKARLRAGAARTPEERAAVDWNAVIDDAANGITEDVVLNLNSGLGWGHGWLSQMAVYQGWHDMPLWIIGMADTTSGYANWLASPLGSRTPFLIRTPDTRFPAGADRATQFANSPAPAADLPSVYFRNREPGDDTPGEAYGNSFYDHVRFRSYRQGGGEGSWVWMSATEISMLQAEGLIRTNQAALAMPLVNASRTAHGLAAFTDPAGRAPDCVPRTPTGPGHALECGSLMEAMKWEKRIETAFTGYVQWFIDARGWGDLAEGTTYMWPVPYQEMDARTKPFYNSLWQAAPGTYGF